MAQAPGIVARFGIDDAIPELTGMVRFLASADPNVDAPALEDWADFMRVRTELLFATGARDGVRWARLKPSTLAGRRDQGIRGAAILQRTGALRRSIEARVVQSPAGLTAKITSDDQKARIHHRGASVSARTIYPKNAKALRFVSGGKVFFARRASIPAFEIPSRPILFISDRDHATGLKYVREHRLKLIRQAIRKGKHGGAVPTGIPLGEVLA